MTDVMFGMLMTNLPATLIALGTLWGIIRNTSKVEGMDKKVDVSLRQNDSIIKKADEIHGVTNGHLSKLTDDLHVAMERITGLEKLVAALSEAKRVAEAAVVTTALDTKER